MNRYQNKVISIAKEYQKEFKGYSFRYHKMSARQIIKIASSMFRS